MQKRTDVDRLSRNVDFPRPGENHDTLDRLGFLIQAIDQIIEAGGERIRPLVQAKDLARLRNEAFVFM